MFQQPVDFKQESDALYSLLKDKTDAELATITQFKDWSIENVIGHLHAWNNAADMSLRDDDDFKNYINTALPAIQKGGMRGFEDQWLDGLKGRRLLEAWHIFYLEMSDRFAKEDPKKRVQWAGPDMSVRSSITARLMETWAHGQEVYDTLGVVRQDEDRIKNIAVLGVNTFGWTFKTHSKPVPSDVPYINLTAPSGEVWEWNAPGDTNFVEGSATEFCQVVTQARNIGDTKLNVSGETATQWMAIAQCFAGPPSVPPATGSRKTNQI